MKAAVKERPILFSAPMVKAILAGEKTMTRRIVKPQPFIDGTMGAMPNSAPAWKWISPRLDAGYCHTNVEAMARLVASRCLYGVSGDRLWVRETMRLRDPGKRTEVWTYDADGAEVSLPTGHPSIAAMLSWAHHKESNTCVSIHMPRWASRIDLEVTAVRVERLQDITEEDARAEGVSPGKCEPGCDCDEWSEFRYRRGFERLWDEINGDKAPWKSNPWVWVVSFKRVRP